MKRLALPTLAVLTAFTLAMLFAACSEDDGGLDTGEGRIAIVNSTGLSITSIFISRSSDSSWGNSRGSISSGQTKTLDVSPGSWDILAVFSTDQELSGSVFVAAGETATFTFN